MDAEVPVYDPPGRSLSAMAYDESRQYVVMFGGQNSSGTLADTWIWDGSNWTQRLPFSAPSARDGHEMAYVSSRQRVVMVGGGGTAGTEVWEWDGTNWVQRFPSPGASFYRHAMAYDIARDRVVVFSQDGKTWEWDNLTWSGWSIGGPSGREYSALAYDRARGRVVMYGGRLRSSALEDHWEWDGTSWTRGPNGPGAVVGHQMAYHSANKSVFLVSGTGTWEYGSTPAASFARFGQGCQGSHGGTPQVTAQNPILGQNLNIGLTNATPTTVAALMFGASQTSIALGPSAPGCVLLTSPAVTFTLFTDPNGNLANPLVFMIPPISELRGAPFYVQWAVFDSGANNLGLIFSDGGIGTPGF